eukprot:CAMPEP_0119571056 /NCGR_PEP_ID=MMETSP1352-20130426/43927_1 /TAXON_ID=265584 /ORGANISM="Stauroneis constricta, Strain CCMP1120" /LENGTH=1560 /DNA_ID=CAMNT_0007620735 /DNA_START=72 /DNA_END=4756 /DNA_ORIENTATION=-
MRQARQVHRGERQSAILQANGGSRAEEYHDELDDVATGDINVNKHCNKDSNSSSGSYHDSSSFAGRDIHREQAKRKARSLQRSRYLVAFIMLGVVAASAALTYYWSYQESVDDFETKFHDVADELLYISERDLQRNAGQLRSMGATITAFALDEYDGDDEAGTAMMLDSSSPIFHYTQSQYAGITNGTIRQTGAQYVSWSPLIEGGATEREAWEVYAADHYDAWIDESIDFYLQTPAERAKAKSDLEDPHATIFYWNQEENKQATYEATHRGVYAPSWQSAPLPRTSDVVNLDMLSHPVIKQGYEYIVSATAQQSAAAAATSNEDYVQVLTPVLNATDLNGIAGDLGANPAASQTLEEPVSILLTPLFATLDHHHDSTSDPPKVSGLLHAAFKWTDLLGDVLPHDVPKMHVVIGWQDCLAQGDDGATIRSTTYLVTGPANPAASQTLEEPVSILLTPLFATLDHHHHHDSTSEPPKVSGLMHAAFKWTDLLGDVLPHDVPKMHVVIGWQDCLAQGSDSAAIRSTTYLVTGPAVEFLGYGDRHDSSMNKYRREGTFAADFSTAAAAANNNNDDDGLGKCSAQLVVYPTKDFKDDTMTDRPYILTVVITVVLAVTFAVFFAYDWSMQKRRTEAIYSAAEANAKISTVIPPEIQDRLMPPLDGDDGKTKRHKKKSISVNEPLQHDGLGAGMAPGSTPAQDKYPESSKYKLRNYLNESKTSAAGGNGLPSVSGDSIGTGAHTDHAVFDKLHPGEQNLDNSISEVAAAAKDVDLFETKPIADLFPNTTVLFADIAGFTAWSSVREPSQVFTLLETTYSAFDKIARQRKVFKVETVGDCYVAVTGLPRPTKHHATIMVQFAKQCRTKFNELVKQMEVTLGPDTGELGIRMGMHSGPVTAGVLRGDKSRFQLFGDTVNTAARIETTGSRNRIHISSETAELIIAAGKEEWIRKRPDTVTAKGKGTLQTYWINVQDDTGTDGQASSDGNNNSNKAWQGGKPTDQVVPSSVNASNLKDIEESLPPNIRRLVQWNVEILKKLLKQIIAKRQETEPVQCDSEEMRSFELQLTRNRMVLDEVVEIISLPKYKNKPSSLKAKVDVKNVKIPDEVVEQLKQFVYTIAALHKRTNPFHNFEHASHVTMSVSKLLSRIVAPDIVGSKEDLEETLHDHTYGITSDPLTQFAVVLSALVHDADHSGVSNMQLIKEDHKLAEIFNNKSVAEQNSVVLAWEKLMCSPFLDLRRCIYSNPSEMFRFRQIMVNTVLATDIFDKELQTLRRNRWDAAFRQWVRDSAPIQEDRNRKATIVMEHLIQASDVSHTMQHWHVYQKWNERLFSEMTAAYRNGRMDKDPAEGWYNGELWFFDNYVIPLAKKLKECGVFGVSSDEYLQYALENRREWQSKGEEIVTTMVEKYKVEESTDDDTAAAADDKSSSQHEKKAMRGGMARDLKDVENFLGGERGMQSIATHVVNENGRMDKDPAEGWYKGELWFFDNYVIPLAKKLKECGVFGVSSDEYLQYALENRREWQSKGQEIVTTMVEKYKVEESTDDDTAAAAANADDKSSSQHEKKPM